MKTEEILASVMILGLLWWVVFGTEAPPPPVDPPPDPVPAGAPIIDTLATIDYQSNNPGTSRFWIFFTDPDTNQSDNGDQTWQTFSGNAPGVYIHSPFTHNTNERQEPVDVGIWYCAVEDYQGNRSAEVAFEMLADGTLQLADGSTPPDPLPDPVPGVTEIRLEWVAPTENDDGTPLVDLAGYRVYRGPSSGVYDTTQTLQPNSLSLVQTLPPGLYYFCVTAFDTSGNESPCGGEVSHEVLQ